MLATNACGDDTSKSNGDGDGDTGDGDGDKGGDGDGDGDPAPLLPPNTAGLACTTATDCGPTGKCQKELTGGSLPGLIGGVVGGGIDLSQAAPGNYCSATCKKKADCGAGSECFGLLPDLLADLGMGLVTGECRQACAANTDCREGYECAEVNAKGIMATLPAEIASFAGVLTGSIPKTCAPKPTPVTIDDATVGKKCSSNAECGAGTCAGYEAPADGGAATFGYCSAACVKDQDSLCGATEGVCTGIIYGTGGQCAEKCTKASDCKLPNATCSAQLKVCTPGEAPEPEEPADAGADAN